MGVVLGPILMCTALIEGWNWNGGREDKAREGLKREGDWSKKGMRRKGMSTVVVKRMEGRGFGEVMVVVVAAVSED